MRFVTVVAFVVLFFAPLVARADETPPAKEAPEKAEQQKKEEPSQAGGDPKIDDAHEREEDKSEHGAHAPARQEIEAQSAPPQKSDENDPDSKKFTLSGYVETFYQWNLGNPSNGITNYRYDDRHNTITLSNAVLDAGFRAKDLMARIALQAGHTSALQYRDEPRLPGADGANESDDKLWRHLQRASAGWQPTEALLLEGGLFLNAFGFESFAVKDNWNWSRSFTFVALPTYQTGFKATVHLGPRVDVIGGVYNGWNTLVDNNDEKSFFVQGQYKHREDLTLTGAYYGGVERDGGALEGRAWRHAGQIWGQWDVTSWFEVAGELDGGCENNRFGLHWFAAALASMRFRTTKWLYVALRGERLWEDPSANASGSSVPFLLGAKHVSSGTATLDFRPVKGLSLRVEGRYDRAATNLFFDGQVDGAGTPEDPYVPNARSQTTFLLGATAWF